MSDYSISIVPRISSYPGKEEKAKEIRDWLLELDIVKQQRIENQKGRILGYSVSDGAKEVVKRPEELPYELRSTVLEIELNRMVFGSWQYGITSLTCPSCKQNISEMAFKFAETWYNKEQIKQRCPKCGNKNEIHSFTFHPPWGFSDLGFTFWNWTEFTPEFLDEFKRKLGIRIDVVGARI